MKASCAKQKPANVAIAQTNQRVFMDSLQSCWTFFDSLRAVARLDGCVEIDIAQKSRLCKGFSRLGGWGSVAVVSAAGGGGGCVFVLKCALAAVPPSSAEMSHPIVCNPRRRTPEPLWTSLPRALQFGILRASFGKTAGAPFLSQFRNCDRCKVLEKNLEIRCSKCLYLW